MKAIETVYNGYRFRSRLEARWAVFFNVAGIKYEYEPEGFDLGSKWYLPDFYLTGFDLYVEIKPSHMSDDLKKKCESLCNLFRNKTGASILLCYGDPAEATYLKFYGWEIDEEDLDGGTCDANALFFADESGKIKLCIQGHGDTICVRDTMLRNDYVGDFGFSEAQDQNMPLYWGLESSSNNYLYVCRTKARQARFEHGEQYV